jgi:hypothetical protein
VALKISLPAKQEVTESWIRTEMCSVEWNIPTITPEETEAMERIQTETVFAELYSLTLGVGFVFFASL